MTDAMRRARSVSEAIAKLLVPDQRATALATLEHESFLHPAVTRQIRDALAAPAFNDRSMSKHVMTADCVIDSFINSNSFSPFSAAKFVKQIDFLLGLGETPGLPAFTADWLAGKRVLDFGSGTMSALNIGIILFANGAEHVHAVEPAPLDMPFVQRSARRLCESMLFEPERFVLPGGDPAALKARLATLDLAALAGLDPASAPERIDLGGVIWTRRLDAVADRSVDLVRSVSVLEHVMDLDAELAGLRRVCRDDALMQHVVDFSSHDRARPDKHAFRFYFHAPEGPDLGLNQLRVSAVRDRIVAAGFSVTETHRQSVPPKQIDTNRLRPDFAGLPMEDLTCRMAILVARPV